PLHGLETILAAARIASELPFRIVGSGQLEGLLASRPENVEWVPWVEYEQIPDELGRARCALGIFGTSDKAHRVIPNKAFQALACGVPLVTGDTPAARELLVDGESALLVPPGDPAALAAALRRLAADPDLSVRIAARGQALYEARASEAVLGARWRGLVERLLPCDAAPSGACCGPRWSRSRPRSRHSRSSGTAPTTRAGSTSGTWSRPSGRPLTATRSGSPI